ncbi:MAG: hypothetical protein OEY93_06340 [Anaerolineae bacterium]|nr:hypothetical protein [Anaerolineae bacterium]
MVQQSFRHSPKTSVRASTTAHLVQTMSLLVLNNAELMEKIAGELSKNPALELIEDHRCPTCGTKLVRNIPCSKCSFSKNNEWEPVVYISPSEEGYYSGGAYVEESSGDDYSPQHENLPEYLLSQIASELAEEDRPIAAHVLTSLDENGLLDVPKFEISRYLHVPISRIDHVISQIQHCDPPGVGSSTPQEALQVQLGILSDIAKIPEHTAEVIEFEYESLIKRQFPAIAKNIGISQQQVKEISNFITDNLYPFPARAHWGNVRHQSVPDVQRYYTPDVIISRSGDGQDPQLFVEILWPIRGNLKINESFLEALSKVSGPKADDWRKDIENANLLIKCLSQRNHTLVRLMEMLASVQRDFILHGDAHLKPITRAKIADDLGVHEATISRAVSGKSVQLPNRQIIPISRFFDRSLHIRTALRKIVDLEKSPLSDTKIAAMLEKQGYNIARRTVAKYRSMEGILSAHQRGKSN